MSHTIEFWCEMCGGRLIAEGLADVAPVERNHLATCPALDVVPFTTPAKKAGTQT